MIHSIKFQILELFKWFYCVLSFFLIDAGLRVLTRWLGFYSIYKFVPSMFSLCWIVILLSVLSLFPQKVGRWIYGFLFVILSIYAIAQYMYYLVFDRFIFLTDLKYASEGADYASFVGGIVNKNVILYCVFLIIIGCLGFILFPERIADKKKRILSALVSVLVSCGIIACLPTLYQFNDNSIFDGVSEYKTFTSSGYDMELVGYYHFIARDTWVSFLKPKKDTSQAKEKIEQFFLNKTPHQDNEMTGFFKGKNLIVVQMESIDDWIVSEEVTPTIYQMMQEGICFSNMYAPCYGTGWTFGTEFAFLTGIYQGGGVLLASNQARNQFPYSLPNLFASKGYFCQSFHENASMYYSRGSMHNTLGLKYFSTRSVLPEYAIAEDDVSIVENDDVWNAMTKTDPPFFDFIITFSAHLPYNANDGLSEYALKKFPEYRNTEEPSEVSALYAKARLTDEMFKKMLERLEEDNLLEDTIVIAFADHYCYGLNDKDYLNQVSCLENNHFLEKIPAFIWYNGCEPKTIQKSCQTIDWLPTIANLFDVAGDSYNKLLGHDSFDPSYEGLVVFPENSWIAGETVVKKGKTVKFGEMNEEEINNQSQFISSFYEVDRLILTSDYYADAVS